ncbi:MAG: TrmB family transcriptional regulator [Nitrososphaerota archaeon]|nr:TrmB family transcriptional regulator [Nitrososphaerota archaeon]
MSIRGSQDETEDRFALDNLALDLSTFGMSLNQSKVYLYLLANGSVSARNISKDLGLHRVDVYRKLRDLQNLGVIEIYLGSPKTYIALEPKAALTKLLGKMESRLSDLRKSSVLLENKLREFQSEYSQLNRSKLLEETHESNYRVGFGTERYYTEITQMIRNAKNEVLTVVSARGVKQIFTTNLHREYIRASKRGVILKFITEIGANNSRYVERLSSQWQTRLLKAVHLRFVVADRSVAILRWQIEPFTKLANQDDNFFVTNDSKFALSIFLFFEDLWQYGNTMGFRELRNIEERLTTRR